MSDWTLSGAPLGAGGEGLNLSVVLKLIRFVHNGVVLLLLSTVSRSGVQRGPPLWNPPVFHILTFSVSSFPLRKEKSTSDMVPTRGNMTQMLCCIY